VKVSNHFDYFSLFRSIAFSQGCQVITDIVVAFVLSSPLSAFALSLLLLTFSNLTFHPNFNPTTFNTSYHSSLLLPCLLQVLNTLNNSKLQFGQRRTLNYSRSRTSNGGILNMVKSLSKFTLLVSIQRTSLDSSSLSSSILTLSL